MKRECYLEIFDLGSQRWYWYKHPRPFTALSYLTLDKSQASKLSKTLAFKIAEQVLQLPHSSFHIDPIIPELQNA